MNLLAVFDDKEYCEAYTSLYSVFTLMKNRKGLMYVKFDIDPYERNSENMNNRRIKTSKVDIENPVDSFINEALCMAFIELNLGYKWTVYDREKECYAYVSIEKYDKPIEMNTRLVEKEIYYEYKINRPMISKEINIHGVLGTVPTTKIYEAKNSNYSIANYFKKLENEARDGYAISFAKDFYMLMDKNNQPAIAIDL